MKALWITLLLCQVSLATTLQEDFYKIRNEAIALAGAPDDIPGRVEELRKIYIDSKGLHAFSLIAAHGAKWGAEFFSITGPLIDLSSSLLWDFPEIKRNYQEDLRSFSLKFQKANRQVFIDTYTNYYFSKKFGRKPEAANFIRSDLLKGLNLIHKKSRLSDQEKKNLFITCLLNEQEYTVTPAINKAIAEMKNYWLLPPPFGTTSAL